MRSALALEWATLVWLVLEAGVALAAGLRAGSLSVLAFGVDGVIEFVSAGVLIWRLNTELRHGRTFSERAEHRAARIGGSLLFALAVYVVLNAAWKLWMRQGQEFTLLGLAVAVTAIPVMLALAKRKLKIAGRLGSRAMRADAAEGITCCFLSAAVVAGLLVQLVTGLWWVDALTSLGIVWFVIREGREAWRGEPCCDDWC